MEATKIQEKIDAIQEKLDADAYSKTWKKRKEEELEQLKEELAEIVSEKDEMTDEVPENFESLEDDEVEDEKEVTIEDVVKEKPAVKVEEAKREKLTITDFVIGDVEQPVIEKTDKEEAKKLYMVTMRTPKDKKVPLDFKKGKQILVTYGKQIWLTDREYACFPQWLKEVK